MMNPPPLRLAFIVTLASAVLAHSLVAQPISLRQDLESWPHNDLKKISCVLERAGYLTKQISEDRTQEIERMMLTFYRDRRDEVLQTRANLSSERGRYYFIWGFLDPDYGYHSLREHIEVC